MNSIDKERAFNPSKDLLLIHVCVKVLPFAKDQQHVFHIKQANSKSRVLQGIIKNICGYGIIVFRTTKHFRKKTAVALSAKYERRNLELL